MAHALPIRVGDTVNYASGVSDDPRESDIGTDTSSPSQPDGLKQNIKPKVMKYPAPPEFTDKHQEREYQKGRLALACRIFGKLGFEEGVAGHITLRDPINRHHFWVNPFGIAFNMIKRSDLILVDEDGNVIDGGKCRLLNESAYAIHAAIHTARPEVNCAAHSHTVYGQAFCSLGRPLEFITQGSCAFYNDHAVYDSFEGMVLAKEEGENIARALGGKKVIMLQNHGLLTVGETVEAATYWFTTLEHACKVQLIADAAAAGQGNKTIKITPKNAEFTYKSNGSELAGWFNAKPAFENMIKEIGDEYLQ